MYLGREGRAAISMDDGNFPLATTVELSRHFNPGVETNRGTTTDDGDDTSKRVSRRRQRIFFSLLDQQLNLCDKHGFGLATLLSGRE